MKITYRRELKHNYMIIEPGQDPEREGAGYVRRILSSNGIEGVLRFQLRQMDGESRFYYEITSRQPLSRLLEGQCLQCSQIRSLVLGIAQILDRMEQYLLPESCVLLEPEYIYVEPDQFRVWLCLVPGFSGNFPEAYGKLLEYLLGKVDHQDKDSVVLAYGLYQETRRENYGMDDILRYLGNSGCSETKEFAEAAESVWGVMEKKDLAGAYQEMGQEKECKDTLGERARRGRSSKRAETTEKSRENPEGKRFWQKLGDWWRKRFFREEPETAEIPWEMMFEGEQEGEPEGGSGGVQEEKWVVKNLRKEILPSQDTMLLADFSPAAAVRTVRLHSLDGKNEDIDIAYFPFIIGKQTNLVDYVLDRSTVSRLHLRIDREEDQYYAQDLNSTNGTIIDGRLLEANERVLLKAGDEVSIADCRYRFE